MDRLSRYLSAQCIQIIAGLTVLALSVLLLERLPRIFNVIANTSDTLGAAARIIVDITPHHLGEAIPLALFLGVLITVDRVSRTGELSASLAAGVSLFQIVRPFVLIAAGLAVLSLLLSGFLRPLTHYDYRKTIDSVRQRSVEAAFQEGKFAQVGDRIVWTQDRSGGTGQLGQVFIFEDASEDRDAVLTTARRGAIRPGLRRDETLVSLEEGRAITFAPNKDIIERLYFDQTDWNIGRFAEPFRPRGVDEKETTIYELYQGLRGDRPTQVDAATASAVLHANVGRAAILLTFPFLALPLGLGYGRRFSSTGIAVGIIFLVIIQKALESGQTAASSGVIPGWAGTWPIVGAVAIAAAWLFLRSALRVVTPPLMLVSFDVFGPLSKAVGRVRSAIGRKTGNARGAGAV